MATSKGTSKTGATSTAKNKSASTSSKADKASAKRAATEKTGTSKRTNSGGTRRTDSKQAEPTISKQAKAASTKSTSTKRSGSAASKSKASASKAKAPSGSNGRARSAAAKTASKSQSKNKDGNGLISKVVQKVSGLFKGVKPDAVDLLKADHDVVEKLFEKVKGNEDGNNRAVFKKIKTELDTHTHIEEKIFYPRLLEKGNEELQKIVREGIEEHRQVKMFLTELEGLAGTSDAFKAKLKVVIEDVEHHVKEEENEMFPMVRDQMGGDVLQKLGTRMQAEKIKFKEKMATKTARSSNRTRAASAP